MAGADSLGWLSLLLLAAIVLFALRGSFGKRPKLSVGVSMQRSTFFPGDVVSGTVMLQAGENLVVEAAVARLQCREAFGVSTMPASGGLPGFEWTRLRVGSSMVSDSRVPLDVKGELKTGDKKGTSFSFVVPSSMPPTRALTGEMAANWSVEVNVQCKGKQVVRESIPIDVQATRVM